MYSDREMSLTEGPITRTLVRFLLPILLALALQALYGAVDVWAVGRFATAADVSAVATGSQAMCIVTGLITGLSMGTTIELGQRIGQNDRKRIREAMTTSLVFFLALSLVLTLILTLFAGHIARLINAPPESMVETTRYIRICGFGTLFIVLYNVIASIYKGFGNSRDPLIFVAIAAVTNIVLDVVFIECFDMGTHGAAYATVIAQALSVAISIVMMKKEGLWVKKDGKQPFFVGESCYRMVHHGAPIALQAVASEVSYMLVISLVNMLGMQKSAGVGIAEKIVIFVYLIPQAMMSAVGAFVAQNKGAGRMDRARHSIWSGTKVSLCIGFIAFIGCFFYGDKLASIFIRNDEVAAYAHEFLKTSALESLVLGIAYNYSGYFTGVGKSVMVMVQSLIATFVIRIPYAVWATYRPEPTLFNIGLSSVWAALFILLTSLIAYRIEKKRNPLKKKYTEVEDD